MVQALTHGNELCGAIALDFLLSQGLRQLAGTCRIPTPAGLSTRI